LLSVIRNNPSKTKISFASYFHPETCNTSIPRDSIEFIGQSLPYFDEVRDGIRKNILDSELLLSRVPIDEFKTIHEKEYIDSIVAQSEAKSDNQIDISIECTNLFRAIPGYEYGLGGVYSIIDLMKQGILDRAYSFSLPSHHAYKNKGHGYCLLNTEAVAVKYAQSVGFKKVLIIDWDIHHGDGTQSIFENDNSVYCISIHSVVDLYMSMMDAILLGTSTYGKSVGHCNIPVLDLNYSDDFYYNELGLTGKIFRDTQCIKQFEVELNDLPFNPELIVIFDGHDSHKNDCGNEITNFSYDDFRTLIRIVKKVARKNSCPILSMPGGGYDISTTIQTALVHIEELKIQ
jgi:acetoin utilization deacetylase AcuC-like enzyme